MSSAYYETRGKMKGTARDLADMMEVMRGYTQGVKDTYFMNLVFTNESEEEASFFAEGPYGRFDELFGSQRYEEVGGHLFAIAVDKSIEWGHDGACYGNAANAELVKHYVKTFHAEHFPWNHPYQIVLGPYYGKKLLEVYTYEWN